MLLTILSDQYRANESQEIAAALADLCNPDDAFGWSSAGLYCFWNPGTSEILYIGLSVDLGRRFKEHSGLVKVDPSGTKQTQVKEFFSTNEKLGFSVLLQSSLDQPNLATSEKERLKLPGFEGIVNVKNGEGTLLKAFKDMMGKFPSWNKMGGSKFGASSATGGHFNFFKDLSDMSHPSVLRSDHSLRFLADDNNANEVFSEIAIHGLRIPTIGFMPMPMPIDMVIQRHLQHGLSDDLRAVIESERGKAWIQRVRELQKSLR